MVLSQKNHPQPATHLSFWFDRCVYSRNIVKSLPFCTVPASPGKPRVHKFRNTNRINYAMLPVQFIIILKSGSCYSVCVRIYFLNTQLSACSWAPATPRACCPRPPLHRCFLSCSPPRLTCHPHRFLLKVFLSPSALSRPHTRLPSSAPAYLHLSHLLHG